MQQELRAGVYTEMAWAQLPELRSKTSEVTLWRNIKQED